MTNFTLGRIGLDADLVDVAQWDAAGETVAVAFSTPSIAEGGSLDRSNAYRQMLLGYAAKGDQTYVPVTWADDPSADGFYRVRDASVTPDADLAFEGLYYFTATLERVQGHSAPVSEARFVYYPRTNIHGRDGLPILGIPTATNWDYVREAESGAYSSAGSQYSASTETGSIRAGNVGATGGSGPTQGELATWAKQIGPADYYDGAARLELNGYPVEGRQVPLSDINSWVLGNGAIRMSLNPSHGGMFRVIVQSYGSGVWGGDMAVDLVGDGSATPPRSYLTAPESITILKNHAEEVIVRFALKKSVSGALTPIFLDVGIRRGMRFFECRLRRASGTGGIYPGIVVPNHVANWGYLDGVWTYGGPIGARNYAWNSKVRTTADWWALLAGGTATGRITASAFAGGAVTTAYRVTASGAHVTTGFGINFGTPSTGLQPNGDIVAGTAYSFGAYVRCSVSRALRFRVLWRDAAGVTIGSPVDASITPAANAWAQVKSENLTAPVGAVRATIELSGASGGAAWTAGDTMDMSAVQIEAGATITATYWDGSTGWSSTTGYSYADGDGDTGPSIRYTRAGVAAGWIASPILVTKSSAALDPWDVDDDPPTWDFGIGHAAIGVTGDNARQEDDMDAYYTVFAVADEVVAV